MTKDEVRIAGKARTTVIYDQFPEHKYRVRSINCVFPTEEEVKHGYSYNPRIEITIVDLETGESRTAGASQLEPLYPELFESIKPTIE